MNATDAAKRTVATLARAVMAGALLALCSCESEDPAPQGATDPSAPEAGEAGQAEKAGGAGDLRFVKAWIDEEKLLSSKLPFLKVEVRNVGSAPVYLGLWVPDERIDAALVSRRRASPMLFEPFRLGLEKRYRDADRWRWAPSHRWHTQRRKADRFTASSPQAMLQPGETRQFGADLGLPGYKTIGWRAVLRDPAGGQIDQIAVEPWTDVGEVVRETPEPAPAPRSTPRDFSDGKPGTLQVLVMNPKGMSIVNKHTVWLSNGLNREVKIEGGRTKVRVQVGEAAVWKDYVARERQPGCDVQVDIVRLPGCRPCGSTLEVGATGGATLGGLRTEVHLPAGHYRVYASTQVQHEAPERIAKDQSIRMSREKVLQFLLDRGYWLGRTGIDKHGPFEIVGTAMTHRTNAELVDLAIVKRYTYTSVNWTDTLIYPGGDDRAVLVLLDDPAQARRLCERRWKAGRADAPKAQTVWDAAVDRVCKSGVETALEKTVLSAAVANAVVRQGAAALIVTSLTDPAELFTHQFLAEQTFSLGVTTYAAALKIPGGGVIALGALILADSLVITARNDMVRRLADTDDLLGEAYHDANTGELVLTVDNYGPPIRRVRLRKKVDRPRVGISRRPHQGPAVALVGGGQRAPLRIIAPIGREADYELVYNTTPYPGHTYEYAKPLSGLVTMPVGVRPEHQDRAEPLTINKLDAAGGGMGGPFRNTPMIRIVADVQNTVDQPVMLFLQDSMGRKFSSIEELENNRREGGSVPFGIGIEGRYTADKGWTRYTYASGWTALRPDGQADTTRAEAEIAPGQTRQFAVFVQAGNAPRAVRVFLLSPDFVRLDERVLGLNTIR